MNVKLNDNVVVIAGKDKGKTGRVVNTDPKAGRVTVQGVNLQKKHQKARKASDVSQIIERGASSTPRTSWSSATSAARRRA